MKKLQPKTLAIWEILNEAGGRLTTAELCEARGITIRQLTGSVNSLVKNELAYREKVMEEGKEKPTTFVQLTEAGFAFVQPEDEE